MTSAPSSSMSAAGARHVTLWGLLHRRLIRYIRIFCSIKIEVFIAWLLPPAWRSRRVLTLQTQSPNKMIQALFYSAVLLAGQVAAQTAGTFVSIRHNFATQTYVIGRSIRRCLEQHNKVQRVCSSILLWLLRCTSERQHCSKIFQCQLHGHSGNTFPWWQSPRNNSLIPRQFQSQGPWYWFRVHLGSFDSYWNIVQLLQGPLIVPNCVWICCFSCHLRCSIRAF